MRHAAMLALAVLAAPTLAQEAVSPGALAAFALEVCVRGTPDVETVETGEFAPSERQARW